MKKSAVAKANKFNQYTAAIITDMLRQNWTMPDVAAALQITPQTLGKWLQSREDLREVLTEATRPLEAEVESAIHHLAVGSVDERVVEQFDINADTGALIPITREVTTTNHAPDLKAGIFWLKNRRPERWHDKQEHDVRSMGITLNLDAKDAAL